MTQTTSLGERIVSQELVINKLLEHASLVGGIYTMGYDSCLVLTNDLWKKNADGIPQHCFLIATAMVPGTAPDQDDEEVILLRVVGPASLPAEAELVQVRAEAMREIVTTEGVEIASESSTILDVLTRNEIQFSALEAKILGTFYEVDVNGTSILSFGSDIETFYSVSRYKVFKPYGESLSIIASYPEVTETEECSRQDGGRVPKRVPLGKVRYSSSDRRRRMEVSEAQSTIVPVSVNVEDFVSLKTAVFGMTRLGKSNTMKIIATSVFQYAAETGQKIGQLLFDPTGEYAYRTEQDQTALAELGTEYVVRYRLGAKGEDDIRPLSTNFFSDENISVTSSIVRDSLAERDADYIQEFIRADIIGPEEPHTGDERSTCIQVMAKILNVWKSFILRQHHQELDEQKS